MEAFEIPNWKLRVDGEKTDLPSPPKKTIKNDSGELIELTPYGLSGCRITAFARLKS